VKNSELFADALKSHKVPYQFMELPTGYHGFGMGKGDPKLTIWTDECLKWLDGQELLKSKK
jgi:dipeptidyl aminopeptidase/acylaminoacyl peptidase